MKPPSTRDIIRIGNSKYAVVVAVAKRARELSEQNKGEDYRVATMVTEAMAEVLSGKIKII